ncbi:hypothetical protein D8Y22_01410 [Salinadaptatus halalkaliphilus]|uniref:Uncharacterized protein n=1 Tax=Salinadaptatus halalkaliphilus TaxID=2419781 RepID=A0A4S3TTH1_9EURY|nr:DUF5802 family protein [Salinadaptatus halalkaliphilus]THE66805.1 hypothetical protein D8Y22_01410 [Salinadaptatus halalkaliphilus]
MFEVFSRSYYLGRLYVTPTDRDHAIMHSDQHERINEAVYTTGDGIESLETPLVMKLQSQHFAVHGDESVPANTLALPESLLEGSEIRNPPSLREVFLARRERARQLLEFASGWEPPGVETADRDGPEPDDGYPGVGT